MEPRQVLKFEYGKLDCCLFVCDLIKKDTGVDLAAPWRGKYKGQLGAFRLIRDAGGFDQLMSQAFGKIKPIWAVKKGDPVLLNPKMLERDSINAGIGYFDGDQVLFLTDDGIHKAPITCARGCFNV